MDRLYLDSDDEDLYTEPTLPRQARRPTQASNNNDDNGPRRQSLSPSPRSTNTATTAHSTASTTLSALAATADKDRPASARAPQQQHHARPKMTILDLVSDSVTSSALPQPFGFSISRKGRVVAIFSTKNIWLVQAQRLPRIFMRTFGVRRKPVAVDVLDDGTLLAVLTTPHKVDLYRLEGGDTPGPEKLKSVILSVDASTIALSPDGRVLACGYNYGIELISLVKKATDADRRSVNCAPMDHLSFSDDGRTLLATTSARLPRPTTVFSVHGAFDGPFTEEGELITQDVDVAWTRQILFPEKAMTAKQAMLLPDSTTGQVNELFAFDAEEDSWGIYDLAGTHFAETKLNPPDTGRYMRAELLEDALPTVSPTADHVAIAVKHQGSNAIWLYRLPDSFESDHLAYTSLEKHTMEQSPLLPCSCVSVERNEDSSSQDIAALRWIDGSESGAERLLAAGNIVWNTTPDTPIMPGDTAKTSGLLVVMDFDFRQKADAPEEPEKMTIDLDETLPAEVLPEEDIDFDREVELVRTRTVAQRRDEANRAVARNNLLRSSTTSPQAAPRNQSSSRGAPRSPGSLEDDTQILFEEPYSHGQPRSHASLNRAATVGAAAPVNRRHLRALPNEPLPYRRADGLREIPHESDADNWVPPPPPYTPNADPPGPGAVNISLTGPPAGFNLSGHPSPPAQHSSLPRLRIPVAPPVTAASIFPHSAPAQRDPEPRSAIPGSLGVGVVSQQQPRQQQQQQQQPQQQQPHARNRSYNRFSLPPGGHAARPPAPARHNTNPDRPSTSPPPTQQSFHPHPQGIYIASAPALSHPLAQEHMAYEAAQAAMHVSAPPVPAPQLQPPLPPPPPQQQQQQRQPYAHHTYPSASTPAMSTTSLPPPPRPRIRTDSFPTPTPSQPQQQTAPPQTRSTLALGSLGSNRRAAQSADDLRRPGGGGGGKRKWRERPRTGLSRLATIRSANSGNGGRERRMSAPDLLDLAGGGGGNGEREGGRRCNVM